MKKGFIAIILLVALMFFTGCTYGSFTTVGSIENNTSTLMSMKYLKFSGHKSKDFTLKENEYADINVEITTDSGDLSLYIIDKDGEVAYEGHKLQTYNFTVTVRKSGKYTVKFEAKDHKGSYSVKWNTK